MRDSNSMEAGQRTRRFTQPRRGFSCCPCYVTNGVFNLRIVDSLLLWAKQAAVREAMAHHIELFRRQIAISYLKA